jgi:hypothetical protein
MDRIKMMNYLENQEELTLIDLMRAYLGKEDIIEIMSKWEDEKLKEALENLGFTE